MGWEEEFTDYTEPLVKHMYDLAREYGGTQIGSDAWQLARDIELKLDKMQDLMAEADEDEARDEE